LSKTFQAAPAHLSQASPQPQSSFVQASSQPPSSFVQDSMNNQREKIGSPQPLEIYCGPSSTYLPYMVSSPQDRPGETVTNLAFDAPFTARLFIFTDFFILQYNRTP
ncbi:hypothetical protein TELCIR_16358, partial [Teladorsagia circumcincta]